MLSTLMDQAPRMILRFEIHDPDERVQAEGVQFTDRTVAIRSPDGMRAYASIEHLESDVKDLEPSGCRIVWLDSPNQLQGPQPPEERR